MTGQQKAIPPDSLVLVTGINGYISSHVADKLLGLGYRVRGTARDQKKLDPIIQTLQERHPDGKIEGVIVKDMASESAFHDAVEGCDGVVHVASDLSFNPDPNRTVTATVNGLHNALKAAASVPSVKRFVLTSSSIAAVKPIPNKRFHIDESSWNEADVKSAWAPPPYTPERSFDVYGASKVESEKFMWEFAKIARFDVNAVLPNFNIGPKLHPSQAGSSSSWVQDAFEGNKDTILTNGFPPQYYVDVEDDALLHAAALLEPDVKNERLFAFAATFHYGQIKDVFQKVEPSKPADFWADAINADDRDLSTVANERSKELLKRYGQNGFTDLETSLRRQFKAAKAATT